MNDIWWQTIGEGDCHLVLLHGWGLNAQVWDCITPQLASHFTLHLVDLPGYGRSGGFGAMSLEAMAQRVLEQAPPQAVWLGWSLGGLVASQVAQRGKTSKTAMKNGPAGPFSYDWIIYKRQRSRVRFFRFSARQSPQSISHPAHRLFSTDRVGRPSATSSWRS